MSHSLLTQLLSSPKATAHSDEDIRTPYCVSMVAITKLRYIGVGLGITLVMATIAKYT